MSKNEKVWPRWWRMKDVGPASLLYRVDGPSLRSRLIQIGNRSDLGSGGYLDKEFEADSRYAEITTAEAEKIMADAKAMFSHEYDQPEAAATASESDVYETSRRQAWERFAAAAITFHGHIVVGNSVIAKESSDTADAMLAEWEKRFGPKEPDMTSGASNAVSCIACQEIIPVPTNAPVGVVVACPKCGNQAIRVKIGASNVP